MTDWAGPKPTGILMYSADGYVSVHIVRDPPARWTFQGPVDADVGRGAVTHFVEGSLQPNEVAATYKRRFRFEGDRLLLTATPFTFKGEQRFNRLLWQRVKTV